jgi:hypothetical protein
MANAYKRRGKASHMPQGTSAEQLYKQLSSAGAKLIAALADEASMAVLSRKHPDDEELYLKWAHARQVTEERQEAYYQCLGGCDYPNAKIRDLVEGIDWLEPKFC